MTGPVLGGGRVKLIRQPLNEGADFVQMRFVLPIGKEVRLAPNVREFILAQCNQVPLRQFAIRKPNGLQGDAHAIDCSGNGKRPSIE
ncbi:hypothetical protein [Cupriavidus necator]